MLLILISFLLCGYLLYALLKPENLLNMELDSLK